MLIEGETFDDILRKSLCGILRQGHPIKPSKGDATEVIGACLKLQNPRARFSRTENRSVLYSALGETLWYLSGSDEFDFIERYIPRYRQRCGTPAHIERSEAAYGPRLKRQLGFIMSSVRKPDTRKAVLAIYGEADHLNRYDVPCTCTLQFFPRAGVLHAMAQMRSNDVYVGMAHDIFAFTLLQELLATSVGLGLGVYVHQAGSFHLYDGDRAKAEKYLAGGIADTVPMDLMPAGEPWAGLDWVLGAEASLRAGNPIPDASGVDPYWQDLARLLEVRRLREAGDQAGLRAIRDAMHSKAFRTFIQDEIGRA
jgi:thymidylate synthase